MRRYLFTILLAALVMLGGLAPAGAQDGDGNGDGDTPPELAEVSAALESFLALESYAASLSQQVDQTMTLAYLDQTATMTQTINTEGTTSLQKVAANTYPNQQSILNQTIEQDMSGMGVADQTTIAMTIEMIVVDDEIYMKLEVPDDMQGFVPEGWQDVTGGASAFPGMEMFDIDQLLAYGSVTMSDAYLDALVGSVDEVENLGEDTLGDTTVTRYRMTVAPAVAFNAGGVFDVQDMFRQSAMPFDIPALIDSIVQDEDTTFSLEVAIGVDDQMLYEITTGMTLDIAIGDELITDPALEGAEMTLAQTVSQTQVLSGFDEPVAITAPDVAE
jgi:hypothetical protein